MKIIYLVLSVVGFVPLILSGDPVKNKHGYTKVKYLDLDIYIAILLVTIILVIISGTATFFYNRKVNHRRSRKFIYVANAVILCIANAAVFHLLTLQNESLLFKQIVMFVMTAVYCAGLIIALTFIVELMRPDSKTTKRLLNEYDARLRDVERCEKFRRSDIERLLMLFSPSRVKKILETSTSLRNIHSSSASELTADSTPPTPDVHFPSLQHVDESRTAIESSPRGPESSSKLTKSLSRRAESSSRRPDSSSRDTESLSRHAQSSSRRVASSSTRAESSPRGPESSGRVTESLSRRAESSSRRAETSRLTGSLSKRAPIPTSIRTTRL